MFEWNKEKRMNYLALLFNIWKALCFITYVHFYRNFKKEIKKFRIHRKKIMLSLHLYAWVLWREITLWWKALWASGSLACPSYCWQFRDPERLSDASDTMDTLHLSSSTIAAILSFNPTKFLCKMNPSFIHAHLNTHTETDTHFFQYRKSYSLLIV